MIDKQKLWYLTIFSLILVLAVYYITMPNELLSSKKDDADQEVVTISENENLVAMRVSLEEEREQTISELKTTLTSDKSSNEDKNNAFEKIKSINNVKAKENALEEKIKKEFNLDNFIKIDNKEIKVVIVKKEHDITLANNIMKSIQKEFDSKMYIVVKFE